ncbi:TetR/AcrR family transcriptional regulator [Nocardia sp. NPDC002869]|uniref:TetR/AcrR family transcriptional regulator n=1 Tax=Nocardia sp. NPDC002869 TaxID=3161032 RepID=UPI00398D3D4D
MGESSGHAGRRRADARRNRDRLITAASAVLAEDGAGASLEEIARRAGVGSATLHRHFPHRAQLLEAVLHDRVQALSARAEELRAASDAGAALMDWLRDVVAHAAATRGFGPALTGYEFAEGFSPHAVLRDAARGLLTRAGQEGSVAPAVTVDDVLQLANGIALAAASSPEPAQRADALLTLVAEGLLRSGRTG